MTLEELRAVALALPETTEVLAWEHEATFRVRGKIFVMTSADPATAGSASVKASKEDQAELVGTDPETFKPAAYVGRFGWVSVDLRRVDPEEMRALVIEAWRRTAPKRLVAAYDAGVGS